MSFTNWLKEFFGFNKYSFEKVEISKDVIDDIIDFARENHPREFIMFFEGKVRKKTLSVYGLSYQEYVANENSAMAKIDFPLGVNIIGSVHSHPGPSNSPSRADLRLFSKHGLVHMIINQPYSLRNIALYDSYGRRINFDVK